MTGNRVEWIDLVRAIAIVTVLFVHASDGIYILLADETMKIGFYSRLFEYASLFIGRIGVPFFLMITGYLLLDRSYDDTKVNKFWYNNCKNLIIVTVIWTSIYAIFLHFLLIGSPEVSIGEAGNLLFSHMWYMPMIIGMYISIPFVASAIGKYTPKTLSKALVVFSLLAFALPFMTTLCDMQGIRGVAIQYCLGFSGGVYGIYIILGYLVKKEVFKKYSSKIFAALAIVSFLICVGFQYYAYIRHYNFFLWYDFPFILIGSFALFELCSRIKKVRAFSLVSVLSKYSFAVFLIHNIFRIFILAFIMDLPYPQPVMVLLVWVLLLITSYIAAAVIYRIPKIGKYVLYMR